MIGNKNCINNKLVVIFCYFSCCLSINFVKHFKKQMVPMDFCYFLTTE